MESSRSQSGPAMVTAMLCTVGVSAQFIAGKATRDAFYLAHLDVTTLPSIVVATAAFSILLVALSSKGLKGTSPAIFVPLAFTANAILLLAEWVLATAAPALAAQAVYLQISGLGPMLGSGFWLIMTDRFDPHTAKKRFGQMAGVGTLSGLLAALLAARVAAAFEIAAMLPVLAALSLFCAWQIRHLARPARGSTAAIAVDAPDLLAESPRSGLRVLAEAPYLQNLAALVLLGTTGATLADYAFKAQAVATFGNGDSLLRFFAVYYAGTSLLAFVVQATSTSLALEKLGVAIATSSPSVALLLGSVGGLVAPGLRSIVTARGGESVFRGSLFRAGYELFYTPIPSSEKRAAKSIIDVGFDRLGDAVGGGVMPFVLLLHPARQYTTILLLAITCSAGALIVARRLKRGYIQTLERALLNRAVELDLTDIVDVTTRTVMLRTLRAPRAGISVPPREHATDAAGDDAAAGSDPEIQAVMALRSGNPARIVRILCEQKGLSAALVPHVIPLLAWDVVAKDAVRALRRVAEARLGAMVDALIDPNQPFVVRRRLPRVFSVCASQRSADGLMVGLDDLRFEVRFQCGRSLAAIVEKNGRIRIDPERTFDVVRREVAVGRPVWESRRVLDRVEGETGHSFVDEFLKDRASRSLAHVFTLLSLVLPRAPLQVAFRGLHTDDPLLRGTALEYLESVLPADIRDRLWPFVEDCRVPRKERRPREAVLADLLRSNASIMLNLEELRRRAERAGQSDAAAGA